MTESLHIDAGHGAVLHVLLSGADGPRTPALLVHGLASNARLWDGVAADLAGAGHPVAAVDQRGHGLSDKPDGGYDYETLTQDLCAVLQALRWWDRRPVVAGQSWGGNVVLDLAARQPGRFSAVVLVDGGTIDLSERFADWPTCEATLAPPPLAGLRADAFEGRLRSMHPDWPETGIVGTLANAEVLQDGTIRPYLSREHHMTILRHMWEQSPAKLYPTVDDPVALVMAEDPTNQRWMAGKRNEVARAARELPRSATHWIVGDHDLHAQHPEVVAGLIGRAAHGDLFET